MNRNSTAKRKKSRPERSLDKRSDGRQDQRQAGKQAVGKRNLSQWSRQCVRGRERESILADRGVAFYVQLTRYPLGSLGASREGSPFGRVLSAQAGYEWNIEQLFFFLLFFRSTRCSGKSIGVRKLEWSRRARWSSLATESLRGNRKSTSPRVNEGETAESRGLFHHAPTAFSLSRERLCRWQTDN